MVDTKRILTTILEIIGYHDDKDVFIKDFVELCEQKAIANTILSLSQEKQDEIQQKLLWAKEMERQKAIITDYLSPETLKQNLQKAAQTLIDDFISTLLPVLSVNQKNELQGLFNSLQVPSSI